MIIAVLGNKIVKLATERNAHQITALMHMQVDRDADDRRDRSLKNTRPSELSTHYVRTRKRNGGVDASVCNTNLPSSSTKKLGNGSFSPPLFFAMSCSLDSENYLHLHAIFSSYEVTCTALAWRPIILVYQLPLYQYVWHFTTNVTIVTSSLHA